jgi:titin
MRRLIILFTTTVLALSGLATSPSSAEQVQPNAKLVTFVSGINPNYADVRSVSCASAGNCVVAGSFSQGNTGFAFTQTQTNGTWADATPVTFVSGINPNYAYVSSVSCASAGNCVVAGGFSQGNTGFAFTTAVTVAALDAKNVPSAPRVWGSKARNGGVTVGLFAPLRTGGNAILGYDYSLDNGSSWSRVDPSSTQLRAVITGLTNGVHYTGMIRAVTVAGAGKPSNAFGFTPLSVPSKPVTVTTTAGSKSIALEFTAPLSDGGSPVIRYGYSIDGGPWKSLGTKKAKVIKNLTNGTTYSVRVVAMNAIGFGDPSESVDVTPTQ